MPNPTPTPAHAGDLHTPLFHLRDSFRTHAQLLGKTGSGKRSGGPAFSAWLMQARDAVLVTSKALDHRDGPNAAPNQRTR